MKELLKKIAISGSGVALLAGTAFASVGNSGTGDNSLNKVDFDSNNNATITAHSNATLNNDLDVNANTGRNTVHKSNAGDVDVTTGSADASADVTNRVNRVSVDATMPAMMSGDVGNMDTGKNSENRVDADMSNRLDLNIDNCANVHNDVDVNANTGGNKINGSGRGDVSVSTGDATASATVTNEVNTTSVTVK